MIEIFSFELLFIHFQKKLYLNNQSELFHIAYHHETLLLFSRKKKNSFATKIVGMQFYGFKKNELKQYYQHIANIHERIWNGMELSKAYKQLNAFILIKL